MAWPFLILWTLVWTVGGTLLVQALFRLPRRETCLIGLGIGLTLTNWLVNWLARIMNLPLAAWISALLVFLCGLILVLRCKNSTPDWIGCFLRQSGLLLAFLVLTVVFTLTGRGLGIFDDYQNLPTVSLIATGDIPPHFALNPEIRFGYHYFLLLLAAQTMRIGGLAPWIALDLTRSAVMTLSILLAGLWTRRFTHSSLAQWTTVWFVALSGGIRWLLLLMPASFVSIISSHVGLIGSAAQSGASLSEVINASWKIEGSGTFPFPFAFVSGINNPVIMQLGGFGVMHFLLAILLLLITGRDRRYLAGIIPIIILASLAYSNEVTFALLYAGLALAGIVWLIYRRTITIPASLWKLAGICLVAVLLAFLQGGMLTEVARGWFSPQEADSSSYYEVGFQFAWPPQFISAHLGPLQLTNPAQLFTTILEIGPVLLILPALFVWGWKALKHQEWMQAGLIASSLFSMLSVFIKYEGTAGATATGRFYGNFLILCTIYAIPLVWVWAKGRAESTRTVLWTLAGLSTFGGSILLGVQFLAAPRPVYAPFLTEMDRSMFIQYWDKLAPGSMVFDPVAPRSPTIFGRATRSNDTWYTPSNAWAELLHEPDPYALQRSGFSYIYVDKDYRKEKKQWLDDPCIHFIQQVNGSKQQYNGSVPDYRLLLDIRSCK